MMKRIYTFVIIALSFFLSAAVYAAPGNTFHVELDPIKDNTYSLGTTSPTQLRWKDIYVGFNSSGETRCLQVTSGGQFGIASAGCGTGSGGDPNVILTLQGGTTYYRASTTGFSWFFPDGFVSNASSTVVGDITATNVIATSSLRAPSTLATSTITNALQLGGTAGDNMLRLTAGTNRDYPNSTSVGGLLNVTNTNSTGAGVVIYSNQGSTANGRLLVVRADNAAFDQQAVFIQQDGTAGGYFVDCTNTTASAECANVTSTVTDQSAFGITGGPDGKGVLKVTGNAGNVSTAILSMDLQDTDIQGIFADTIAGYTGKLINLRVDGTELMTMNSSGSLGLASTTPQRKLSVQGDGLFSGDLGVANLIATGTATTTNLVATNATTTNLSVDGGTLNGGTDSAGTLLLFPTTHPTTGALVVAGNIRGNVNNTFNLGTNAFRYAFLYAQQGMQIAGNQFAFQIANNSGSGLFFNSTDSNIALQGSSADIHRSFLGSPIADGAFWHQPRTSDPTLAAATATGTMHVYDNGVNLTWLKMKASSTQNAVDIEQKQTFAVTPASTIDLSIQPYTNIFAAWSSNEDETVNALGSQYAGQEAKFIIGNGGALPRTITFGTGFNANGNLIGTAGATATVMFVSDGVQFDEFSRTLGL